MVRIVMSNGINAIKSYIKLFCIIFIVIQSPAITSVAGATNVTGNITLITSLGQSWYQQGINGLDSNGWGWTFFDESFSNGGYSSGYITPPEKTTQRNNIYALLLDSGNNSNSITGAQVFANITFWTYDGANYTDKTNQVQLTEDTNHSGFYSGTFYFYGNTGYTGGCTYCHPAHGGKLQIGQFPGNYTATITAQMSNKSSTNEMSFEVTPWGCEECHGSPNAHKTKLLNLDEYCYLCHGLNQLVHRQDDAGNPHQNTAHRDIQCTDCHTNKSLNKNTFNGVSFIPGGINNNKSIPQYNYTITQLNSGTHTNLTCTDCHNDLSLPTPQGDFKQDNYTIQNMVNTYTPSFTSIQQLQDYYVINVTSGGPLNVSLDWEGTSNIGFYLYPPNFSPGNRTTNLSPDKGDYPYYNGSTFTNKPENFTNSTPLPGKWVLVVYGYNLTTFWVGMLQPPLKYTISSTYPIQQINLPAIPECNSCHNSKATGRTFTTDQIPDWNPGFAHIDINKDGKLDIQCRMCHDSAHDITIKGCQNCHTVAPVNHPISEPAFSQYTQNQCLECHGDPHNVTVAGGDTCIECHGTNYSGSSPSVNQTFVNISAFNESIHQNINSTPPAAVSNMDCWACHYNKDMNRQDIKKCGDCHRKPSQWHGNANITTNLSELW
jgi:hypothetical protein